MWIKIRFKISNIFSQSCFFLFHIFLYSLHLCSFFQQLFALNIYDMQLELDYKESCREGNDNPLQQSCLEHPMDRGAWWATVHGVTEEQDTTQRVNNNNRGLLSCTLLVWIILVLQTVLQWAYHQVFLLFSFRIIRLRFIDVNIYKEY